MTKIVVDKSILYFILCVHIEVIDTHTDILKQEPTDYYTDMDEST